MMNRAAANGGRAKRPPDHSLCGYWSRPSTANERKLAVTGRVPFSATQNVCLLAPSGYLGRKKARGFFTYLAAA